MVKQISGGFLLQDEDRGLVTAETLTYPTARKPSDEEIAGLLFAWKVCKHVKSNAIVYARQQDGFGQTVGVGAGQMSRVDAARFGAMKAALPLEGTVAASDAFFPFPDGRGSHCECWSDGDYSAGRIGARCRGDCSSRPAGGCDGIDRNPTLSAWIGSRMVRGAENWLRGLVRSHPNPVMYRLR